MCWEVNFLMLKAVDFFSSFRKFEKRPLSPNPNVDNHMHLKVYPDYRWTFITGSGYTPDPRVWRGPGMPHPLRTKERAVE